MDEQQQNPTYSIHIRKFSRILKCHVMQWQYIIILALYNYMWLNVTGMVTKLNIRKMVLNNETSFITNKVKIQRNNGITL